MRHNAQRSGDWAIFALVLLILLSPLIFALIGW